MGFLSFHNNISLPCISEAATGLIRLHVTVHQKDRNQDQCGRPRRQKAQSLHPFNALWSIIINSIRKLFNLLETFGDTKAQNYIFWENNKRLKYLLIFLTLYLYLFFRKWDSFFKPPNLPKKLFQKIILSLKFEIPVLISKQLI